MIVLEYSFSFRLCVVILLQTTLSTFSLAGKQYTLSKINKVHYNLQYVCLHNYSVMEITVISISKKRELRDTELFKAA